MMFIQSFQELYYALKIFQELEGSDDPVHVQLRELIRNEIEKFTR
ncbi:MAG: hypothetical protein ACFFD4_23190 [Candidatus Odinarchaeota archaeon]